LKLPYGDVAAVEFVETDRLDVEGTPPMPEYDEA
jgi:hypothetical protein